MEVDNACPLCRNVEKFVKKCSACNAKFRYTCSPEHCWFLLFRPMVENPFQSNIWICHKCTGDDAIFNKENESPNKDWAKIIKTVEELFSDDDLHSSIGESDKKGNGDTNKRDSVEQKSPGNENKRESESSNGVNEKALKSSEEESLNGSESGDNIVIKKEDKAKEENLNISSKNSESNGVYNNTEKTSQNGNSSAEIKLENGSTINDYGTDSSEEPPKIHFVPTPSPSPDSSFEKIETKYVYANIPPKPKPRKRDIEKFSPDDSSSNIDDSEIPDLEPFDDSYFKPDPKDVMTRSVYIETHNQEAMDELFREENSNNEPKPLFTVLSAAATKSSSEVNKSPISGASLEVAKKTSAPSLFGLSLPEEIDQTLHPNSSKASQPTERSTSSPEISTSSTSKEIAKSFRRSLPNEEIPASSSEATISSASSKSSARGSLPKEPITPSAVLEPRKIQSSSPGASRSLISENIKKFSASAHSRGPESKESPSRSPFTSKFSPKSFNPPFSLVPKVSCLTQLMEANLLPDETPRSKRGSSLFEYLSTEPCIKPSTSKSCTSQQTTPQREIPAASSKSCESKININQPLPSKVSFSPFVKKGNAIILASPKSPFSPVAPPRTSSFQTDPQRDTELQEIIRNVERCNEEMIRNNRIWFGIPEEQSRLGAERFNELRKKFDFKGDKQDEKKRNGKDDDKNHHKKK